MNIDIFTSRVFIQHMTWKLVLGRNSSASMTFSLCGCLIFQFYVSPKQNSDKMLYLWRDFQKLFDENPQSDFFRVWTSFMFVDKDLWKLKLIFPNKTVTKCYVYQWIFKSCLMKIHKVTSLEYEPVLCLLTKIYES